MRHHGRPHRCVCGQTFPTLNLLREHLPRRPVSEQEMAHGCLGSERVGVDGERWLCLCGQSFPTYPALRNHGQRMSEIAA